MSKASNKVIAGEYVGKQILGGGAAQASISLGFLKQLYLNNSTVVSYELVTDEHRKSAASGITKGLIGGALLGGVGMIAGAMAAKEKGIYQVAIQFKDEKRSLVEIDDKLYKALIQQCFN